MRKFIKPQIVISTFSEDVSMGPSQVPGLNNIDNKSTVRKDNMKEITVYEYFE